MNTKLTEHQLHGLELAKLQMPLQVSALEAVPLAVEGLIRLYGTEAYESAHVAVTSYLVGAGFCLQFGPEAGDCLSDAFAAFDSASFDVDIAAMGFSDQCKLVPLTHSVQ
jgi:hypothetical protein